MGWALGRPKGLLQEADAFAGTATNG